MNSFEGGDHSYVRMTENPAGLWHAIITVAFLTSVIVYLLVSTPHAEAWGPDGHRIVVNMIAYRRLSDSTRTSINAVLLTPPRPYPVVLEEEEEEPVHYHHHHNQENDSPLANIATWTDKIRYDKYRSWTVPIHFVNIQDDANERGCHYDNTKERCEFVYERDCVGDVCAAGAMANYSHVLQEGMNLFTMSLLALEERRQLRVAEKIMNLVSTNPSSTTGIWESLVLLSHFVGDIHQPLHASRTSDQGGNRNDFENDIMKLIDTLYVSEKKKNLLKRNDGRQKSCTSLWAEEGFQDALRYAYLSEKDEENRDYCSISKEYYLSRINVVKRKLALVGVRLAATLEYIMNQSSFVPSPQ